MNENKPPLTEEQINSLFCMALSKVLDWMPESDMSKAILLPDPRDFNKLCAIHNGPDGLTLMMDEGYNSFITTMLCEECQAKLEPFSVIFTGVNVHTGEEDPNAFVGLYGGHDEDFDDEEKEEVEKRTIN